MSYSSNTETVLNVALSIANKLNELALPVRENEREIQSDAITDETVAEWQQIETDVDRLIFDVDTAWTLPTSEEDYVDNNE